MAIISAASSVVHGSVRAVPRTDLVNGVTKVVEWTVYRSGQKVASVPDSVFQDEREALLTAIDSGKPWVPSGGGVVSFDGRTLARGTAKGLLPGVCIESPDLTYEVDENTRFLLGRELGRGGQLADAVKAVTVEPWAGFVRELFARIIGDPVELDAGALGTEWVKMIHAKASELAEWEKLCELGEGDEWISGIGTSVVATKLADKFRHALDQLPHEDPAKLQATADAVADALSDCEGAQQAVGKAIVRVTNAIAAANEVAEVLKASDTLGNTIEEASRAALVEISAVSSAMSALGCGNEPGHASRVNGPRRELVDAFRKDAKLQRVARLAGRLRVAARAAQRAKVIYTPEQVVDVTLGGEVARLLPSELALLAIEETELAEMRRIVEREALQYELQGHDACDRGPLIFCVDESGSMSGPRHELAMATALALIEVAALQKRAFALVHFDAMVTNTWLVERPASIPLNELVKQVGLFSGGGTHFEPPLREATKLVRTAPAMREADVILLTDGEAEWSQGPAGLAELGARLWGIEIGGQFKSYQRKVMAGIATLNVDLSGSVEKLDLVLGI